ncbi:hypothetical protein L915_22010 [Phytophthora nicotianae]|uniref:Uncharacterized protein n=2 Tax=Phytophthora nicotianae TaxID=4792 RepID=W2FIR1_PHYNI|nr:hypothetical protein L915_22010 [Phytophthora nicotianae]
MAGGPKCRGATDSAVGWVRCILQTGGNHKLPASFDIEIEKLHFTQMCSLVNIDGIMSLGREMA